MIIKSYIFSSYLKKIIIFYFIRLTLLNSSNDFEEEIKEKEIDKFNKELKKNKNEIQNGIQNITKEQTQKSKWRTDRFKEISECQIKLFGNKTKTKEYYLDVKTQKIIMEYYKNKNQDFKEAAEDFMETIPQLKRRMAKVSLGYFYIVTGEICLFRNLSLM